MIIFFHFLILISKYVITTLSKSLSGKVELTGTESQCPENEDDSVVFYQESIASESIYRNGELKFFPPVYLQRYETVFSALQESPWGGSIKKVVDFGCSELGFFLYLKHMSGTEEILEVDIDEKSLERGLSRAAPLNSDYLFCKREKPMNVYILSGSIAEYDDCLLGTDAVVAIEVIEHLYPDMLDKVPENIFHNIRPKIAIFTTPNADFNALFPNSKGFRHPDHKFEWSRKEFYGWTQKIIENYPNYSVKFYGIGTGPEGSENLGCCTQMAVFTKFVGFEDEAHSLEPKGANNYKLIRRYEYPFFVDDRSDEEKILNEVLYRMKFTMDDTKYYNYEDFCTEFPLSEFMEYISMWCESQEKLKKILLDHGFHVKENDGCDVLVYYGQSDTSYRADEESSMECSTPEDVTKTDLQTENWDWDCGDGNYTGTSDKGFDEESYTFDSARTQETENLETRSELGRLQRHGTIGDGKPFNDALSDKTSNNTQSLDGRQCASAESFDKLTLRKTPKKKIVRDTLLRIPSRNLVRSLSLSTELGRHSEILQHVDTTCDSLTKSSSDSVLLLISQDR